MDWLWEIFEAYVRRYLRRQGKENPTGEQLQAAFIEILSESRVTVLVQEPWQNSVRFKGLARGEVREMMPLLYDPMSYLLEHFGGGKFKLNFHQGLNFIGTKNFKPDAEPRWRDLPDLGY